VSPSVLLLVEEDADERERGWVVPARVNFNEGSITTKPELGVRRSTTKSSASSTGTANLEKGEKHVVMVRGDS
jgi:hypothetical protein